MDTQPRRKSLSLSKLFGRRGRMEDEKQPTVVSASIHEAEKIESSPPSPKDTNDEEGYIKGFKLVLVMLSVTLVIFLTSLDMTIIATAIPRITSEFHSLTDVGWYGSAYQLACSAIQPLTGKLYTHFRSKWVFLMFFALFEVGSLLCGAATSSTMLIVGRAIAGMGASGLQNGSITIIAASVTMVKRPALMGLVMGAMNLAIALGPIIGGALTEYSSWRWCFYLNLPVGAVVAVLLFRVNIPNKSVKLEGKSIRHIIVEKFDLIGFLIFAPAAIQFLLALQFGGNDYPWNSATIIGLFCGAGGTFIVFLLWEYRMKDDAMVPFSLIRKTVVWCSCIVGFFLMSLTIVASYYIPIYFQAVKGATPLLSGVYMLPNVISQLIATVGSGFLVGKLGYYLPWSIFSAVSTSIANGLMSTLSPTTSTGQWIGYQILLGAGRGAGFQMPLVAVQANLPPTQIALATSVLMFTFTFGAALFLSFAQTIFTNSLRTGIEQYAPAVSPDVVINAGAAAVRNVVPSDELPGVLMAYSKSIDYNFYLCVGAAVVPFFFCWGLGWKDIRKKQPTAKGDV